MKEMDSPLGISAASVGTTLRLNFRTLRDQEVVLRALASFGDVFDYIPPIQQKELFRFVIHKVIVSEESLELALYGKPPQLSEMPQGAARSVTSNWLPKRNPLRNVLRLLGSF